MTVVIGHSVEESTSVADFWRSKAMVSHEWSMLMYRFRRDAERRRRCTQRSSEEHWKYIAELDRAEAIFHAQYLIALACSELMREGMSLDYLLAFSLNTVELEDLL